MDHVQLDEMPTYLGQKYRVDWRGRPPHMLKSDIPVWWRFLDTYGHLFTALYYDVMVGGPYLTEEQMKDPIKKGWYALTAKRIDVLADLDSQIWIIEVNRDPGPRSLGQLWTYQVLWIRDPKIIKPEKLILVAETADPDILDGAATHGVQIYLL